MTFGYRSDDIVITICQNNAAKSIEIIELSKAAEDALAYSSASLVHQPIRKILPPRIAEMLSEYVEYEPDANDVGQVLSRVQSFSIVGANGKEVGYRMKVVRAESNDSNMTFKLVLQDKAGLRQNEAVREALQENFKGHEVLDSEMGLPNKHSLTKDVELMGFYSNKSGLRSCFAILQLDHYDSVFSQYGRDACLEIMKHVSVVSRQNLRPDDVLGMINHKRIGVLIIDTGQEAARIVLNRLRWQVAANPFILPDKTSIGLSVSISFSMISSGPADKNLIDECESALINMGDESVNALLEVGEAEKRRMADNG